MANVTKYCKICHRSFTPEHGKRTDYCSKLCKEKGLQDIRLAFKEKKKLAGKCLQCNKPCYPKTLCTEHMRDRTARRHASGQHKIYLLGSKLSPLRKGIKIKWIKENNPYLEWNEETKKWIDTNWELWSEKNDEILYQYLVLDMVSGRDDSLFKGYYARLGNKISLEDLVIAKIDSERERNERTEDYMSA